MVGIQEEWPMAEHARRKKSERDSVINRFSFSLHGFLSKLLSNLRLSLTLRISLHYAGQLMLSTLLVLTVSMLALCVAQIPTANESMDELSLMKPADGVRYSEAQLKGLPVSEAYLTDELLDNGPGS